MRTATFHLGSPCTTSSIQGWSEFHMQSPSKADCNAAAACIGCTIALSKASDTSIDDMRRPCSVTCHLVSYTSGTGTACEQGITWQCSGWQGQTRMAVPQALPPRQSVRAALTVSCPAHPHKCPAAAAKAPGVGPAGCCLGCGALPQPGGTASSLACCLAHAPQSLLE